jgi:transcription initiation factor IIE alpha subunit
MVHEEAAMTTIDRPLLDYRGTVMFHCDRCGGAMSQNDLYELGLRLPDAGESRDDYRSAELIDDLTHAACILAHRSA